MGTRATSRTRKLSQKLAVVDDSDRQQALQARLDALENDNDEKQHALVDDSDDEFIIEEEVDEGQPGRARKKKKKVILSGRRTRGARERHSAQSFAVLLDEAALDTLPEGVPTYLNTAMGPSTTAAPRKFCSVCGSLSAYTCVRCGITYCCIRCYTVHTETKCLKFL